MIEERIRKIAENFSKSALRGLAAYPIYQLDGSWPSIGTVDLILSPFIGRDNLTAEEGETVFGACCYLGCLAHDCWSSFPGGANVSLALTEGDSPDVMLVAEGGDLLKNNARFSVAINQAVRRIYKDPQELFEVFPGHKRPIVPSQSLLGVFASGLVTGLTTYGKGPWSQTKLEDHSPALKALNNFLAHSAATFYTRAFPDDEVGRSPDLFKMSLVFPPLYTRELYPAIHATDGLTGYLRSRKYPLDKLTALATNLALVPDETISAAGFALGAAILGDNPPREHLVLGRSWGVFTANLRPAVINTRGGMGIDPAEIMTCIEQNDLKNAERLCMIEKRLNLLPLLRLSTKSFSTRDLWPAIESILCFNPDPASTELYRLFRTGSLDDEAVLQLIYLDYLMGRLDRAAEVLTDFSRSLQESSLSLKAGIAELRGLLTLASGDLQSADNYLRESYDLTRQAGLSIDGLSQNYSATRIALEDYTKALEVTGELLRENPYSVDAYLRRITVFERQGKETRAERELLEVASFAYCDRRIASRLLG